MLKVAKREQVEESDKQLGQCSACLEMTTVEDPCCSFAGVLIEGEFVRPQSGFGDGEE